MAGFILKLFTVTIQLISFIVSHKVSVKDYHFMVSNTTVNLTLVPERIDELFEDKEQTIWFNWTCCDIPNQRLSIQPDDSRVGIVSQNGLINLDDVGGVSGLVEANFTVKGKRLGFVKFNLYLHSDDNTWDDPSSLQLDTSLDVIVLRERGLKDDIYRYGIIVLASLIYLGFGCKIHLDVIWKILKKPIAPAIGVFCQFVIMPLLGFGVAKMIQLDDVYAFGLLTMSCSPGGGGSNVFAFMLGGDLELSITMTFLSTLLALGFMPFWMWAFGRFFIDDTRVDIPYASIARSLLTLVIPLLIGVIINRFIPKVSNLIRKVTKPLSLIFILYMLTYGTYVNLYIYVIMGTVPKVIPAAILLPWLGFGLGYLIARFIGRQPQDRSVTVAVETGYQNPSIPIIMLQSNFVQPEGDLGAVMPVATAFFTPIPLYFAYCYLEIKNKCCKKDVEDNAKPLEEKEEEGNISTPYSISSNIPYNNNEKCYTNSVSSIGFKDDNKLHKNDMFSPSPDVLHPVKTDDINNTQL